MRQRFFAKPAWQDVETIVITELGDGKTEVKRHSTTADITEVVWRYSFDELASNLDGNGWTEIVYRARV